MPSQVTKTTQSVPKSLLLPLKRRLGHCSPRTSLLTVQPTISHITTTSPLYRSMAIQSISFKSLFSSNETAKPEKPTVLSQDDLFHPLSQSPIAQLRIEPQLSTNTAYALSVTLKISTNITNTLQHMNVLIVATQLIAVKNIINKARTLINTFVGFYANKMKTIMTCNLGEQ
ncbi:unnamed protein product [Absidia cylindrospora]